MEPLLPGTTGSTELLGGSSCLGLPSGRGDMCTEFHRVVERGGSGPLAADGAFQQVDTCAVENQAAASKLETSPAFDIRILQPLQSGGEHTRDVTGPELPRRPGLAEFDKTDT